MEWIETLNDTALTQYRQIRARKWAIENDFGDSFSPNEKENAYHAENNFLRLLVEEFDIDDTRPWKVSEVTGVVFYTEEKNDRSRADSVDKGKGDGAEGRESGSVRRDPGERE